MKYALLIYDKPGSHQALSPSEFEGAMGEYTALAAEPACQSGAQLQPVDTATTVQVRDGQTLTSDGPFAESAEVLGGYYVFEAGDLDGAVALAARIPSARLGGKVEVRPLVER